MTLFDPTPVSTHVPRPRRPAPLLDCGPHRAAIADRPPEIFRHGLADHATHARNVALALELGLGDRYAWHTALDDLGRPGARLVSRLRAHDAGEDPAGETAPDILDVLGLG